MDDELLDFNDELSYNMSSCCMRQDNDVETKVGILMSSCEGGKEHPATRPHCGPRMAGCTPPGCTVGCSLLIVPPPRCTSTVLVQYRLLLI